MHAFTAVSMLAIIVGHAAAQCSGTDNARCSIWIGNGFCTSSFYSSAQKQQFCGIACGLCTSAGQCKDGNANCAKWAAAGQCSNEAVKTTFCCATCKTAGTGTSTTTSTAATTTTTV